MKKLITLFSITAAFLVFAVPAFATTIVPWYQGFEIDTSGWYDSSSDWYGTITRVPSGTNGITSFEGGFNAIMEGDDVSAPFSRFAGYSDEWPGTWKAEIAVYLDPAWADGTGFDYSVAANGSDNAHQRDYIFHVTKDTSTAKLYVAGSNNTNFAPREDLKNINHYEVTSAGWYTLQHVFRDESGSLAVDLNLLDSDGNVLFTEVRHSVTDTIPGEVGGNRYAWFTFINVPDGIAVDAHKLDLVVYGCMDSEAYNYNPEANVDDESCLYVVGSVNGGGHVLDETASKRKDWLDVSFGTWLKKLSDDSLIGSLQVNLHNVKNDANDKAKFYGSDIVSANFFTGNTETCDDAVNYTVNGIFNGVDGHSAIFRAGDDGSPNTQDTARVTIFDKPNGTGTVVFDTLADFGGGPNCVGSARTGLDTGNITIDW